MIKPSFIVAVTILMALSARAQELSNREPSTTPTTMAVTEPATAPTTMAATSPPAVTSPIDEIDIGFAAQVADAKQSCAQAIADLDAKRIAALKRLQDSAMSQKNLELAIAARAAMARTGTDPGSAPATEAFKQITEINHLFEEGADNARKTCDELVAQAAQRRIAALKELQDSAMLHKNLDLAVAARDQVFRSEHPAVRLTIAGRIDGSDFIVIDQNGATWKHGAWGQETDVTFNGARWDMEKSTYWANTGETRFLPFNADFNSARVVSRSGRDVVALEKTADGITVIFADSANGSDNYTITLEVSAAQQQNKGGAISRGQ